jgi:O-antigen chain-terminating methyltransferase
MVSPAPFDADGAISAVLAQLVELESHGLFHTDLRTWNVIFDAPSGRWSLIDFGAISTAQRGAFEAFLAFCYAVLTRERPVYPAAVWPHLDPEQFPERYRALVEQIRRAPKEQLTFAQLQRWLEAPAAPVGPPGTTEVNRKLDMLHAALEETVNAHVPRLAMVQHEMSGTIARLTREVEELRRAWEAAHVATDPQPMTADQKLEELRQEIARVRKGLDDVQVQVSGLLELKRKLAPLRPLVRLARKLKLF